MDDSEDEVLIDSPARGSRHLIASVHKASPHAIAQVLSKLSTKIASMRQPIDISLGYLEHALSSEDNRAQVTIGFFARSKSQDEQIAQLKQMHAIGEEFSQQIELKEDNVRRLVISLPSGKDQDNVSKLLAQAAETLHTLESQAILDLMISSYQDDTGIDRPQITIYYQPKNRNL